MAGTTERLLSPREVAAHTGLSYRTVLRAIEAGELPASRLRNRLRISRYDMLSWIDGATVRHDRVRSVQPRPKKFARGSLRRLHTQPQEGRHGSRSR